MSDNRGMAASKAKTVARCTNCARLERKLHELEQRIIELQAQINRNASNSSLPPSANPPWAPRAAVKKPTGAKPGGQPGHPGHCRRMAPAEQVDEIVAHASAQCRQCGASLEGAMESSAAQRHQVMELPRRAVKVTEHQAIVCRCGVCGASNRGSIPRSILCSVVGPRLTGAISFASARMHGSRRAAEEFLSQVLGAPLSLGSVMAKEQELSAALAQPHRQAKEAIAQAPAKNVDETGWKRAGRFLWAAATRTLAVFHLDPCRNRDAMRQLLGEPVQGTVCSDRFSVYGKLPLEQRALCWAHLKRDFKQLSERAACAAIGRAGEALCGKVHRLWRKFLAAAIDRPTLQRRVKRLRGQMRTLLKRGRDSACKKAAGFCRELLRLEPALWTFTRVEGIEPTNNHAERMLRPAVMWRKQSLGSHSLSGCRFVERTMTALQTLKLQGRSAIDYFEQAIHAFRHGLSPPSLLAA